MLADVQEGSTAAVPGTFGASPLHLNEWSRLDAKLWKQRDAEIKRARKLL